MRAPSVPASQLRAAGEVLRPGETESIYSLARDLQQPVYSQPAAGTDSTGLLQLHIPLTDQGRFAGVILGEYSIDGLLRYGVPAEVSAKYAVALLDGKNRVLAGNTVPARNPATRLLPWAAQANEYEVPVSPVGNGLIIRAQAYRTSLGVIGSGLFWLVGALSVMTGLDADRQLAPHAPPHAGAAGAGGRNQLPPRDGKLHAHRHARARHAGPHHLRERRVLPDDGLERSRTGGPHSALPLLARGRPRTARGAARRRIAAAAPSRAASRCASSARTAACSMRGSTCRR